MQNPSGARPGRSIRQMAPPGAIAIPALWLYLTEDCPSLTTGLPETPPETPEGSA